MKNKELWIIVVIVLLTSCRQVSKVVSQETYNNPVIAGFYPDPSVCRVGDDYYLVNSSFAFYPGLPIFHSKDLVSWNQIGNVINRPEQINYDSLGISEGLFAPTIRYHKGVYYVVCTLTARNRTRKSANGKVGNFIVTATNPAGPWSDPVYLPHVGGIDPDIFFDEGKAYITSCDSPDSLLYWGHRAIRLREFNLEKIETSKESVVLVNGGTDISKEPIWIEGPHLYKINDFYYLMCAEGGTSQNHSEVIFRSKSVNGPYESYVNNPILTQRHLPSSRVNPITNVGHADLVQTQNGEWWTVFLGCRPYDEQNYFNTGRETFLLPVSWENNWPVVLSDSITVPYIHQVPNLPTNKQIHPLNGNFTFTDEFTYTDLPARWLHIRSPKQEFYKLNGESLEMKLLKDQLQKRGDSPAFIGHRQQHINSTTIVKLDFNAQNSGENAGLTVFQNENFFYYICQSMEDDNPVVCLYKSNEVKKVLLAKQKPKFKTKGPIYLKIVSDSKHYSFAYSTDNIDYLSIGDPQDVKHLSTKNARGFVGAIIGMHASADAEPSTTAKFLQFKYTGNDDVY